MDSTKIKEAFQKAKRDIDELRFQLVHINEQLEELKRTLQQTNQPTNTPTHPLQYPTLQHIFPTNTPTHPNTPKDNLPLKPLKSSFSNISTRNEGVPTDRQTNQQTDQHIIFPQRIPSYVPQQYPSPMAHVADLIDSLDEVKHSLRQQFKSLTVQELLVFSTIYQLEEEGHSVDYPLLASRLKLSESSIRDYVLKLLRKGIPLQKTKENNKKIRLTVPQELKKVASLQALLNLREL